jgi:hypothetical protein
VKLVMVPPPIRKSRKHMLGAGIGKIWMAEDAFSPETDKLIEDMFDFNDPDALV